MQSIPIISADTLPSDHPVAKLKAMLDEVKDEPVESIPDIKTKTASATSTAHSDKKNDVDDLATALTSLSIKPAATQIYPRTHLFGIPQELQDQIFDEVFGDRRGSRMLGADNLEPLLTCRHIYHVAHEKAWASTIFMLHSFGCDNLARVFAEVPDIIKSRKVLCIAVSAAQVQSLIKYIPKLPSMDTLYIAAHGLDCEDDSDSPFGSEPKIWYDALWRSSAFVLAEKADDVLATSDIFHDGLSAAIANHGMMMTVVDVFSSMKIVVRGDEKDGVDEHWIVHIDVGGEMVEHKVWSDGSPVEHIYEGASAPQSFVFMPSIFGMMPSVFGQF